MSWLDHLVRARRHLAASGLSPRIVTMLLSLWVDQVEREGLGEPPEGVTLHDWLWLVAPLGQPEAVERLLAELKQALPKILRSGRVVRERHHRPDRPPTYRLIMPRSFHGVRKPVDEDDWL